MKVFKFGGASVKDADSIKNVASIVKSKGGSKSLVVVSAMGKTTNRLEELVKAIIANDEKRIDDCIQELISFHIAIADELGLSDATTLKSFINDQLLGIKQTIRYENPSCTYDQVVSIGEILASYFVSSFLKEMGMLCAWSDARQLIYTDDRFQEANVDWPQTSELVNDFCQEAFKSHSVVLTQGFIGHCNSGLTTTLGREGSDFSAAIFAFCLNAESVTIWKDVPGMLNADPKYFNDTKLLSKVSYKEAIELSYFGASVIHPKTVKPLQNKNILLYVKSFMAPDADGTLISEAQENDVKTPSYIIKKDQVLLSISTLDFSFINEDALSTLFDVFHDERVKINLMQNSALSFSILTDQSKIDVEGVVELLSASFNCKYNTEAELVTIMHYDNETIERITRNKNVLIEQKTRNIARLVLLENTHNKV